MRSIKTPAFAALCLVALSLPANAAINNVRVVATTATQAIISYEPTTTGPCTLHVSESASLNPLVHDVDPLLFPGSDLDNREGNTQNAATRTFVVGRHGMSYSGAANPFMGSDGVVYSRALQTATLHYFRLVCSSDVVDGSFVTAVTPLGKTFSEPIPTGAPGQYNFPTLVNDRNQTIVDPSTGVLLRRITIDGDESPGQHIDWFSGGSMLACSPIKRDGGYLCQIPQEPDGYQNLLYWISAATGKARYLGEVIVPATAGTDGWYQVSVREPVLWDRTDPNTFYYIGDCSRVSARFGYYSLILKVSYSGNLNEVAPHSWASLTATNLTKPSEGRALEQLLAAFDSSYDPVVYRAFFRTARQGDQILFAVRRGSQDSYGFLGVYDLLTNAITALADVGHSPKTRWCGIHGLSTGSEAVFLWGPQNLLGGGSSGPWDSLLAAPISSTSQSDISVSGEPRCTDTSSPCRGATSETDTFLQNAAVGDLFRIGSEWVRITARPSPNKWTIQRGVFGSTPGVYAEGSTLRAMCNATVNAAGQFASAFWDYVNDPHGTDTSNVSFVLSDSMVGAHMFAMGGYWVMADYSIIPGALPTVATKPVAFRLSEQPSFAGVTPAAAGNTYQKHPSYHNYDAGSEDKTSWFLDYQPFIGGNLISNNPGLAEVSGSLYRYLPAPAFPINGRVFDVFGTSFRFPLKNVSGPSAQLTGSSVDNYKFCIAEHDGECYGGSTAGEVYVNAPEVALLRCAGGESTTTVRDVCIGDTPMYGQSVSQFGLNPGNLVSSGPPPTYGALWSRVLVSLTGEYRSITAFAAAKSFADGSWVVFPTRWNGGDPNQHTMAAKVPPYPTARPLIDLSDFQNATISIPNPSGTVPGTSNVVVTFGYAENGPPDAFMCTQRSEPCVKGATQTGAFAFAGEPVAGVLCASGCTVSIPVVPERIAYYRVVYRDASMQTLATGPLHVITGNSTSAGGTAAAASPANVRVIR